MRLRLLILLILTTAAFTAAQTHSQWFYNPSSINCSKIAVGYAPRSYYADTTALKNAFLNACENYAKYERVQVMGNRSYWSTENGTYTMNSSFSEVYDTAMAASLCRSLKIIDTMITESYLAVAVGSCSYEEAAAHCRMMLLIQNPSGLKPYQVTMNTYILQAAHLSTTTK